MPGTYSHESLKDSFDVEALLGVQYEFLPKTPTLLDSARGPFSVREDGENNRIFIFFGTTCGGCVAMAQFFDEIQSEFPSHAPNEKPPIILVEVTGQPHAFVRNWLTNKGICLLYTSPSPRDGLLSRMPSSA